MFHKYCQISVMVSLLGYQNFLQANTLSGNLVPPLFAPLVGGMLIKEYDPSTCTYKWFAKWIYLLDRSNFPDLSKIFICVSGEKYWSWRSYICYIWAIYNRIRDDLFNIFFIQFKHINIKVTLILKNKVLSFVSFENKLCDNIIAEPCAETKCKWSRSKRPPITIR